MLYQVPIEGRLTADPELRFTPSGKAVATFNVATGDRRKKQGSDEWEDVDATFWRCTVWDKLAENIAESLQRGDAVLVIGKIKQRSFETKEGDKRTVYECDAKEVGVSLRFRTIRHGEGKAERGSTASAPASDPWAST